MSDQEFKRALGYASAAFALLKRSAIPPQPRYYELLYIYASGINAKLNASINAILRDGGLPSEEIAESLYNEFLRPDDRISSVSERMHARIDAMNGAIDNAMNTAALYSGSLESATDDLARGLSADQLRLLAGKLLRETRVMQDTNLALESQLEVSRDDITALQQDLDEVRRESLLDPLTKIANRKSFDESLIAALSECRSAGTGLSLMLIDIDHFKSFNDSYGHQIGDQVLRLVATTIKCNIKGKDLAARYGGEEFAAILPATDLPGALAVAESVRQAIQGKELLKRSTNEKLGRITASFGVARLQPGDSMASLIGRADQCLYAAKRTGRNRVVCETELDLLEPGVSAA